MWTDAFAFLLLASLIPAGALAQASPPGSDAAPADARASIDAARASARDASLAALSPDHRAKIQAVVDAFDAPNATLGLADASAQIDAVLTTGESAALLDQQKKFREAMRAAFRPGGAGDGPPGGFGGGRGGRGFGGQGRRQPDAGRFFLSVDADSERYRDAMEAEVNREIEQHEAPGVTRTSPG